MKHTKVETRDELGIMLTKDKRERDAEIAKKDFRLWCWSDIYERDGRRRRLSSKSFWLQYNSEKCATF